MLKVSKKDCLFHEDHLNKLAQECYRHSTFSKGKMKLTAQVLKKTFSIPGEMAELGVFKGGSAKLISKLIPFKKLHLFDTFTGMPQNDIFREGHRKGDFSWSFESTKELLSECNVEFHVGFFPDTAKDLNCKFSFVHIDADIYESTKSAIDFFYPKMETNGILLFDDYKWRRCPGVQKALEEKFSDDEIIPLKNIDPSCQCYVIKTEANLTTIGYE